MRNDLLVTTTQGIRGGKHHSNQQGQATILVSKGYNEPKDTITVDCFRGLGHTYEPREKALITIECSDGLFWSGTFDDLKSALIKTS